MKSPIVSGDKDRQHYSDLKVMPSATGFYIGTTNHEDGYPVPGTRESGYYRTHPEAEMELQRREALTPDEYRIELYRWAVQTDNLPIRAALEEGLRREMQSTYGSDPTLTEPAFKEMARSPDPAPLFERLVVDVAAFAEARNDHFQDGLEAQARERLNEWLDGWMENPRLAALEAQQDAAASNQAPDLTPGLKR